ncbi:glycoside hydrolase family 43 protein [Paenibacillus glycanilyticus]|uniref:glycoside hydrolase family 43 protein n=1 Tax=Paenibacillus glycanilyticus TaxID=126569 RepID=UPI00203D4E10|nr:glycoside hydrolase family 43 protein [Paenibacillus glycanilyticus]MCM3628899.1 glycoside hydrolase family 43 protein [Paenibacillus glycanilyticus]
MANRAEGKVTYRNPVLPGFYPDPSAIRVGEDYYMVTSTFEYFPGVPVFHSKDLIHWEQIGHVLTRESQVNLLGRNSSEGIYAPTLRYHDGMFYMITTDVYGIGNFYVTAEDPAGPWSDPIRIPHGNIDPSLFFDDDGKVYVSAQAGFGETSHIIQYEIDIRTGSALSEPVVVWEGDEGPWVEGPHLYKINGFYYMMTASGGTGPMHREIIGRSITPYGPFDMLPHPILTHNQLKDHPIQYTGHVELIDDIHDGWWALFLGIRPQGGKGSVLGRETFLAPVTWTEDGWPMIDNNEGHVSLLMEAGTSAGQAARRSQASPGERSMTKFAAQGLGLEWFHTRSIPGTDEMSFTEREGCLRLSGNACGLREGGANVFVCRRQQHHRMRIETRLNFAPRRDGEQAGIAARLSDKSYYSLGIAKKEGQTGILVTAMTQGTGTETFTPIKEQVPVRLSIRSDELAYELLYTLGGASAEWISLGTLPAEALTPDAEGAFTGVCLGMFAVGTEAGHSAPAYYDYFEYEGMLE